MSSRYFVGLALIVLVGGYTSCIPFKKSAKRTLPATDSNLVTAVPSDTAAAADVDMALVKAKEELITAFSPLLKTPPAFTTFNGRARMHFEGRDDHRIFQGGCGVYQFL